MSLSARRVFIFLLSIPLMGCGFNVFKVRCQSNECLTQKLSDHEVRRLDFWQTQLDSPIDQRIANAPRKLIDYIQLDNQLNGYPAGIRKSDQGEAFVEKTRMALAGIPSQILSLFDKKLAGIYLVSGLGTTGYTESINNKFGEPVAGFIVIDTEFLDKKANEWASWKDATAFTADSIHRIRTTIETSENNTVVNAIQFILLHELGHVLSIGADYHPDWSMPLDQVKLEEYPFARLSWRLSETENEYYSVFDTKFNDRQSIVYYRQARITGRYVGRVLKQLEKTNFVSPYAATRVEEDFAETFAIYVHNILMHKPYRVEAMRNDQSTFSIGPCFLSRCRDKLKYMLDLQEK